MRILSLIILSTLLYLPTSVSQGLTFKHLSNKDGLISNSVMDIIQDSDGFMWFGTKSGLCRYDGYSFLNFFHTPADSQSLSNNFINCLIEDENENLWIGTTNGLNLLNRETYKIKRFNLLYSDSVSAIPILSLTIGANGKLWIGTENSGLYCLDTNTYRISNYTHSYKNASSIADNTISCMLKYQNGLLVGTNNGLDFFDSKDSIFKHLIDDVDIRTLSVFNDSTVFIGLISENNYYYKLHDDFNIEKIFLDDKYASKKIGLLIDSDLNSWMSIQDMGLLYTNYQEKKTYPLVYDRYKPDGISSNTHNVIYEDRNSNIWIGSYDAGINVFFKDSKAFLHVKDNFHPNGLKNNRVRSVYQDSEGDIWIGTKVNGSLSKFNRETLTFNHYTHNPQDLSSLSNDFVFCITEDKPGYLWVGTFNGLNLFNKKTGKFKVFLHDPDNPNSLLSNYVNTLFKDGDSLYIGHAQGLDIYNTKTNVFSHFQKTNKANSLSDNRVKVIFKDSRANIWIGTNRGLNLFKKETGTFQHFINIPLDSTSISDNYIQNIFEDEKQNFWIGTILGINLMNREDNTFQVFTTKNGLPGNSINGILDDSKGNLWLSTNNGLSRFNPEAKTFKNYNIYDGLQNNEFSPFTFYKTNEGELIFGGDNGFNIFHPDKITDNLTIPKIVLTDFKLSNQKVPVNTSKSPLKKHISHCDEITLNHKQSVLTFEYVALNYISSEKNEYAYIMEGFEGEWNYVGTKREATYTNLDPGNYVFRVKASNNDGYWNEEGVALKIKILPPLWFTWWAFIVYFLLTSGLVIFLWIYSIYRVKEKNEKELYQQNLNFFINISHELRTPLTLILNPIQNILNSKGIDDFKEGLQVINMSANKLMNIVNQLLDFRRTDLGRLSLKAAHVNIVPFTKEVFYFFEELAKTKHLNLHYQHTDDVINAWIDTDKYEKILNNLLSNAIKFTPKGGEITLSISKTSKLLRKPFYCFFKKNECVDYFEIRIKDTGVGLSKKQLTHLFERYYSNDALNIGTGVGLNYTKSLVELHGGTIKVESNISKGSTFIILLPVGKKHLKENQIANVDFNLSDYNFRQNYIESLKYDIAVTEESYESETNVVPETIDNSKSKQLVVLIVEDNKELRKQIRDELKNNYIIMEAINGVEGWLKTEKYFPDLIISDIMMPKMNGIELCQKVKTSMNTCHIPVILLTAKNLVENKIEGFRMGADDYISKPFVMEILKARILNILTIRQKLKEKYSLSRVLSPAKAFTTNNLDEEFLDKVTKIVVENIANPDFSQDDLRNKLGLSRPGMYKKIQALTSSNPSIFIRNIKLKYAAELLLTKKYSIKEVAYQSGFNSPSYFSKTFFELFEQTPLRYIENNGVEPDSIN